MREEMIYLIVEGREIIRFKVYYGWIDYSHTRLTLDEGMN